MVWSSWNALGRFHEETRGADLKALGATFNFIDKLLGASR
jgi:hypothetical protein